MPSKPKEIDAHPDPPPDLHKIFLPIKEIKGPFWRFFREKNSPITFNRENTHRFNAPGEEFGILYLGLSEECAFIETYGWLTGIKMISETDLKKRRLAKVTNNRTLNLVDLTGKGLALIGADNRICSGCDYEIYQKWSLKLWAHPQQPDGLLYRPRHDPSEKAIALCDRKHIMDDLFIEDIGPLHSPLNVKLLDRILNHYDFRLIPA